MNIEQPNTGTDVGREFFPPVTATTPRAGLVYSLCVGSIMLIFVHSQQKQLLINKHVFKEFIP